jgi:hypothetical protein
VPAIPLGPQEHDHAMHRHAVAIMHERIIQQDALRQRGIRTGLEFHGDDVLQGIANAQDKITARRNSGQIDIEHAHGPISRPGDLGEKIAWADLRQFFQCGVKREGHSV